LHLSLNGIWWSWLNQVFSHEPIIGAGKMLHPIKTLIKSEPTGISVMVR